jgi:hypothetical protein
LVAAFPYFLQELRMPLGVLPDLHIGFITTSMGAGAFTGQVDGCDQAGTGELIVAGDPDNPPCGRAALTGPDRFLSSANDGRRNNFAGRLEDMFACFVRVGNRGCRFPQPLRAAEAALGTSAPLANRGFLREDAFLAIVLLSDVDDCSAPADTLLFDPSQDSVAAPLGPLSAFRCLDASLLCDGHRLPRAPSGPMSCMATDLLPGIDPQHALIGESHYESFFQGLKLRQNHVITASLVPDFDPVSIEIDPGTGAPGVAPSCMLPCDGSQWTPQYRLSTLSHLHLPICQGYDIVIGALGYTLGTWLLEPPPITAPG